MKINEKFSNVPEISVSSDISRQYLHEHYIFLSFWRSSCLDMWNHKENVRTHTWYSSPSFTREGVENIEINWKELVDFCFERWTMSEMRQGALQNRIYQVDFRVNVLWESWLRINVYKVVVTLNFKHFLFIKYMYCMFWCVFLVNILKYGKISSLRVSIYSVLLVILQSYTQTVFWSIFSWLGWK